jgi:hypothetical protein
VLLAARRDDGNFLARDCLAFACLVGGGVGEQGVAGGVPAGAGVGEVADDEDGLLVGVGLVPVVRRVGGCVHVLLVSGSSPGGALGAEFAEGHGVVAGFGEEVAAEAEHVRPWDCTRFG